MEIARVYHWGNEPKSLTHPFSRRRNNRYCRSVAAYIMSDNWIQTRDICQGLELEQGHHAGYLCIRQTRELDSYGGKPLIHSVVAFMAQHSKETELLTLAVTLCTWPVHARCWLLVCRWAELVLSCETVAGSKITYPAPCYIPRSNLFPKHQFYLDPFIVELIEWGCSSSPFMLLKTQW